MGTTTKSMYKPSLLKGLYNFLLILILKKIAKRDFFKIRKDIFLSFSFNQCDILHSLSPKATKMRIKLWKRMLFLAKKEGTFSLWKIIMDKQIMSTDEEKLLSTDKILENLEKYANECSEYVYLYEHAKLHTSTQEIERIQSKCRDVLFLTAFTIADITISLSCFSLEDERKQILLERLPHAESAEKMSEMESY